MAYCAALHLERVAEKVAGGESEYIDIDVYECIYKERNRESERERKWEGVDREREREMEEEREKGGGR